MVTTVTTVTTVTVVTIFTTATTVTSVTTVTTVTTIIVKSKILLLYSCKVHFITKSFNRQTDRPTTGLLELLGSAKNTKGK